MYFDEEEEQYMSEAIDEKSESSYIKINKRFLQQLKQTNQINDLSRYRQDSGDEQDKLINNFISNQQKSSQKQFINPKIDSDESPIKSNFYKDITGQHYQKKPTNDNILNSIDSQDKSKNETPQDKQHFMKLTQKISKLSDFDKKQVFIPSDNTFEYYLVRKSHDRKYKDPQFINKELQQLNTMNDFQTKHKLFNSQDQVSPSNKKKYQPKVQFDRINYKKILQNQISKNKDLEKQVYKLEQKIAHLNIQYEESMKFSKKLQKQLNNANKIRNQNKNRIKELDLKLEGFKNACKVKNNQKDYLLMETKKQNKELKQQNQKYRIFTQTLAESIFILKGKKPKNLEGIWLEWKDIFETFSKKKWTINNSKSPHKGA